MEGKKIEEGKIEKGNKTRKVKNKLCFDSMILTVDFIARFWNPCHWNILS